MSSEEKTSISSQPTPTSSRLSLPSRKSSFLTIVKAQVAVLLSTLSENTYSRSVTEISSVNFHTFYRGCTRRRKNKTKKRICLTYNVDMWPLIAYCRERQRSLPSFYSSHRPGLAVGTSFTAVEHLPRLAHSQAPSRAASGSHKITKVSFTFL